MYDWDGKVYRLASSPDSPVSNVAIPPKLRSLAGSVQLAGQFGVQLEFVLEVELDCVGPAHPL